MKRRRSVRLSSTSVLGNPAWSSNRARNTRSNVEKNDEERTKQRETTAPPPLTLIRRCRPSVTPTLLRSTQAAEQLCLIRSTVDAVLNTVLPEGNFPSTPASADDRCLPCLCSRSRWGGAGGGAVGYIVACSLSATVLTSCCRVWRSFLFRVLYFRAT